MITEDQLREALKRCPDEDTKPLGDEVPVPDIGPCDRPWDEWRVWSRGWIQGVDYRRSGILWAHIQTLGVPHPTEMTRGACDGWLAQQMEYLRWVNRDENTCPECFGEPGRHRNSTHSITIARGERCKDGHRWHWCPEHGVKVAGEYDYDKQPACTCGTTEKEGES